MPDQVVLDPDALNFMQLYMSLNQSQNASGLGYTPPATPTGSQLSGGDNTASGVEPATASGGGLSGAAGIASGVGAVATGIAGTADAAISAKEDKKTAKKQLLKAHDLEKQANAVVPEQIANNPYFRMAIAAAQGGLPGYEQALTNIKQGETNAAYQGLKGANSGAGLLNYLSAVTSGTGQEQKLYNENAAYISGQKATLTQTALSEQDAYNEVAKSEKEKLNAAAMQYENAAQQWEQKHHQDIGKAVGTGIGTAAAAATLAIQIAAMVGAAVA